MCGSTFESEKIPNGVVMHQSQHCADCALAGIVIVLSHFIQ